MNDTQFTPWGARLVRVHPGPQVDWRRVLARVLFWRYCMPWPIGGDAIYRGQVFDAYIIER